MRKTHTYCPCLMVTGFIYSFQTQMTSWFNLIAANRIIHRNKLPKWFYRATKIFNNNGNHGHDVWLYYFITALGLCICRAVTNRTWCVSIKAQHAVVGSQLAHRDKWLFPEANRLILLLIHTQHPQLASQILVLCEGEHSDPLQDSRRLFIGIFWLTCSWICSFWSSPTPKLPKYLKLPEIKGQLRHSDLKTFKYFFCSCQKK